MTLKMGNTAILGMNTRLSPVGMLLLPPLGREGGSLLRHAAAPAPAVMSWKRDGFIFAETGVSSAWIPLSCHFKPRTVRCFVSGAVCQVQEITGIVRGLNADSYNMLLLRPLIYIIIL